MHSFSFHNPKTPQMSLAKVSSHLFTLQPRPPITLAKTPPLSRLNLSIRRRRQLGAAMGENVPANDSTSTSLLAKPADVVREFYASVNSRNVQDVHNLIAENCVYEDFVYSKPFVGRKAVVAFFKKFMDSLSHDLLFVIDDISKDDSAVVGVAWHLAWRGKPFPFSKGCSFYRCDVLDGKMQILYGRDAVEPALKPGNFALVAVNVVTTLFERFPWLAEKL